MKSKIEMKLKIASTLKKKDKLVKKLKAKFVEGADEEDEEEDKDDEDEQQEQTQEPLALNQCMGEDKKEEEIEGSKEEEAEEAPTHANPKKRTIKIQPVAKARKTIKPRPSKPTTHTTRAST